MSKVSTITVEQLKENGWVETGDQIVPIIKCLTDKEHEDYDPEEDEGDIELILHHYSGQQMFALSLPDGARLDINPATIEDLIFLEQMILGYSPNY